MIPLAANPFVLDPRGELSPSQIAIVRELDHASVAYKVRNGWRLGGFFRRASTMRALTTRDLVREDFAGGRHVARLTAAGRLVAERLSVREAGPVTIPIRSRVQRDD